MQQANAILTPVERRTEEAILESAEKCRIINEFVYKGTATYETNLDVTRLDRTDVDNMFKRMQSSKSCGPSGIDAVLLKNNNRKD